MANDRSIRLLSAMGGASTSRVLNLHQIARQHGADPEFQQKPLFLSPVINRSFVLKHRLRADETYLFSAPRAVATKIIIPFDNDDLKAGGYGMFVGERSYSDMLRQAGHYKPAALESDMAVLGRINALPSLDPFLLREQLRFHNIEVAPCYFPISEGDRRQMQEFAERELSRLVLLVGGQSDSARFVGAMLSNDLDQKLAPLRETLGLSGEEFREGVFSWRGFLYYKWSMLDFWPEVMNVLRDLKGFQPARQTTAEQKSFLAGARRTIIQAVRDNGEAVTKALSVYDHAYGDLVANQSPKIFRDFLLSAPTMFLDLGEKLGAVSHIVSLWKHRFAPGLRSKVDADELSTIFHDFIGGFGEQANDKGAASRP
jgi:hypothetical protein